MKLKITIIEDEKAEQKTLISCLRKWNAFYQDELRFFVYDSAEDYFSQNKTHDSHIIFLDIQLKQLNGVEAAKLLRKNGCLSEIIFLTAFREYVFEGYFVHAFHYLLKPVSFLLLSDCMNEIRRKLVGDCYFFNEKNQTFQIPYADILAFSSSMHYVDILTKEQVFHHYAALRKILPLLPPEFVRCHRSYIVHMAHIYKLTGNTIFLSNHMTIPIGKSYLEDVREKFLMYSMK